jgi:FKBP-type peptidyl-prolyl cis-trans isomerase
LLLIPKELIMKLSLICFALLFNTILFAQSKKELEAQVSSLKAEIELLKKPKQVDLNNEHKKASYGLGVLMASNVKKQGGDSLDVDAIAIAMQDVFLNKPLRMNEQECMTVVQPYMQKAMERKSSAAKEEGKSFLEANKTKEGVVVTASGLQYKVLISGKGKSPGPSDNVTVNYTGKLIDGTVFDSSVTTGKPASFGVSNVIPGWAEALQLMHEGDKWLVFVPYQLAYGDHGAGGQIPPFAALIFEVELIKVN